MRHWNKLLAFGCVSLLACAPQDFEPDEDEGPTAESESAILLGGFNGPYNGQCEGYTGGGGQRVRGKIDVELLAWNATTSTYRITVSAENWKKNIGWNLKRTSALKIEGKVEMVDVWGNVLVTREVNVGTGGDLKTFIGQGYDIETVPGYHAWNAELTFYGRDGTVCTL